MRRSAHEYKRTRTEKLIRKRSGKKGLFFRWVSNFFILLAVIGILGTFGPALLAETHYRIDQIRGVKYSVSDKSQPTSQAGLSSLFNLQTEQTLYAPDPNFSVIIPAIGASAKVVPNVDPANEDTYLAALKQGIAHAKGSVFPDQTGTTYLFAHSTDNFWDVSRYNAVFYLLKNLTLGDKVVVFYKGVRYNYEVVDVKIIGPNDVSYLNNAQKTRKQLILQTCWPPGTTLRRLIVIAYPIKADD